jgi:hypothetical protein
MASDHAFLRQRLALVKWLAFNRPYNDLGYKGKDHEKVLAFAEEHQNVWDEVSGWATHLVFLECIGGERVPTLCLPARAPPEASAWP